MTGISYMLTMFAAVFVMRKAISVPGPKLASRSLFNQIKMNRQLTIDEFNSRLFQKDDDDRRAIFGPPAFPSQTFNGGFVPNSCKKCKYFIRDPENANGGKCFLYPKIFDMIPQNIVEDGLIHNNYHACDSVRKNEKMCGKMARHFEAKW